MGFRLSAFYFAFFAYAGAYVAYFPLYLASRGLGAVEIAWVLALPPLVRIVAPGAWGWIADRTGAHRAIVAFSCAVTAAAFALLPFTDHIGLLIALMSVLSAGALPIVEAITLGSLAGRQAATGRSGCGARWVSSPWCSPAGSGWTTSRYRRCRRCSSSLPLHAGRRACAACGRAACAFRTAPLRLTGEVRALFAAGFCNAVAHGALYAFLTLHLEALGYSATSIGLLWTSGVLAEIVVFLYLPHLFRRYALSTILIASLLLRAWCASSPSAGPPARSG